MTKKYLLRRSLVAGVSFAVATASLGVVATGTAFAGNRDGVVRSATGADAIKDSYIVVLKDKTASAGSVQSAASSLSRVHGGVVKQTYSNALKGYLAQMSAAQAKRVAAQPQVAYVEQNRKVRGAAATPQPNPPSWGLDRIDQTYLPLDKSYTALNAGSGVHVYVIDSGINRSHAEFAPSRASYGLNFAPHNYKDPDDPTYGADPVDSADSSDCLGHGTHVAGTVGGNTYGVAKGVSLVAVRVLNCANWGTTAQVIDGVNWVKQNAVTPAVANMSIVGPASTAMNDAVKGAIEDGITFTISAGNDGWDACRTSPASTPSAITVGAVDSADRRAWFSNYGKCVDVFAPGVDITSAWVDPEASAPTNQETNTISGTSMAAPHVAGAAAMLLADNPALTPAQVEAAIVGGAVTGEVSSPGMGSPNKLLQVGAAAARPGTVLRLRAGVNNQIVTAEAAGARSLIANRTASGLWEEFEVVATGDADGSVALRSRANGKFVTAEAGGAQPLIANRTAVGLWEKFILTDTNGSITLKAVVNHKYVAAESAGSKPLIANRDAAGAWETFTVAAPPTAIALLSYAPFALDADGAPLELPRWVAAENGGNAPLIARTPIWAENLLWETFDVVELGNGSVALRSYANGKYVTAESGGNKALIANRTAVGAWEMFRIVTNADGTNALKADVNGKYVTAEAAGSKPLIANRTAVGQWETFDLLGM